MRGQKPLTRAWNSPEQGVPAAVAVPPDGRLTRMGLPPSVAQRVRNLMGARHVRADPGSEWPTGSGLCGKEAAESIMRCAWEQNRMTSQFSLRQKIGALVYDAAEVSSAMRPSGPVARDDSPWVYLRNRNGTFDLGRRETGCLVRLAVDFRSPRRQKFSLF